MKVQTLTFTLCWLERLEQIATVLEQNESN